MDLTQPSATDICSPTNICFASLAGVHFWRVIIMKGFAAALTLALVATLYLDTALAYGEIHSGGKYAEDYPETIQVINNGDETVSFLYCEGSGNTQCRGLGSKQRYKMRDLRRRQQVLRNEARRKAIADGAFVAASAAAGTIVTLAAATPIGAVGVAIYAMSGAAGGGVFIARNYLLPGGDTAWTTHRNARTLENRILAGETIAVHEPINEFAQRLDKVLKDIF